MARHDRNGTNRNGDVGRRVRLPVTPLSERGAGNENSPRSGRDDSDGRHRKGLFGLFRTRRSDGSEKLAKVKWPKRNVDFSRQLSQDFDPQRVGKPAAAPVHRQNAVVRSGNEEPPIGTHVAAEEPPRKVRPPVQQRLQPESRTPPDGNTDAPVQPAKAPKEKEPLLTRSLRILLGLAILSIAALVFVSWVKHERDSAVPPIVMPQPYFYEEEQPVRALLLWHEKILRAPAAGTVQLTYGAQPAAVAANDVVATVLSRGRTQTVRAPMRGYFLPALDGMEDSWDYSRLWLGSGLLPQAPENNWIDDLAPLGPDRVVGKLIYLPQSPRAIFYLNLTDMLKEGLQRGSILIRRVSRGPKWSAHVRVYVKLDETRVKVAIDMPYFPMDMILSREADFLVCSDEDSGLIVPDTAVVLRNGSYGVFELVADRIEFREVTGKPVSGGRFFVSSGLQPGNPVILNAAEAEEKRVRLW
jgi:hypothetical protein